MVTLAAPFPLPLFAAAIGCGGVRDTPNTILGVQVVAIETEPAEPAPTELLRLRAWVADGHDRGADTLVWLCTPYEGRCLEAFPEWPENPNGLPVSVWARVGRARPTFETSGVGWPLFADIADRRYDLPEELRGKLLVWALACTPGVCDIIDRVAANPVITSEAYASVARELADPASWIDDLPRRQVSVALKVVPVDLGDPDFLDEPEPDYTYGAEPDPTGDDGPNRAPTLRLLDEGTEEVRVFEVGDLDADEIALSAFVTAGGVHSEMSASINTETTGRAVVMHQAPIDPRREGVMYVVLEDGNGGTSVWSDHPDLDPCNAPTDATLLPEGAERLAIRPIGEGRYGADVSWRVRSPHDSGVGHLTASGDGLIFQSPLPVVLLPDPTTCADQRSDVVAINVAGGEAGDETICSYLGNLVTLTLEATMDDEDNDEAEVTTTTEQRVLVPGSEALERLCREL